MSNEKKGLSFGDHAAVVAERMDRDLAIQSEERLREANKRVAELTNALNGLERKCARLMIENAQLKQWNNDLTIERNGLATKVDSYKETIAYLFRDEDDI